MAMDALRNLTTNIPDWQTRLDVLSTQIERRQAELAALGEVDAKAAEVRSLRNKGSTESLKPKDDGPSHIGHPEDGEPAGHAAQTQTPPVLVVVKRQPLSPSSPAAVARAAPNRTVSAAGPPRLSGPAKKRIRSSSIASADGPPPPALYRTRNMIIVYYDSYVQGFFDDLVRFISSSRNLMRKAKMAAKVAQIKRLAEMEFPDDDNASGDDKTMTDALPSLRYMSARRFGPTSTGRLGAPGSKNQPPDVYDNLDKSLEYVQSTCEHGAHQFLRDADCNEEIRKIQQRMCEVLAMATQEAERVQREEPELAKETGDVGKIRQRRPISIRRELAASHKDETHLAEDEHSKLEVADHEMTKTSIFHLVNRMEADTCVDPDESINPDAMVHRLQYRSTRDLRARAN